MNPTRIRNHVKEKGKEQIFQRYQKEFGVEIEMIIQSIDSLEKYDEPVG